MENINNLTEIIIGLAIKVHTALGPGLLESTYKECLYFELTEAGLVVEKEKSLPLIYRQVQLDCGYRIDLLVEKQVVIEVRSLEALAHIHLAHTLTFLDSQITDLVYS